MVKTVHFQCKWHEFSPWLGNYDSMYHVGKRKRLTAKLNCSSDEGDVGAWSSVDRD